jgi:hypothetical protein
MRDLLVRAVAGQAGAQLGQGDAAPSPVPGGRQRPVARSRTTTTGQGAWCTQYDATDPR